MKQKVENFWKNKFDFYENNGLVFTKLFTNGENCTQYNN